MSQMPKGGCFAFSRLASHIRRVLSKSGEKPALLRKTTILKITAIDRPSGHSGAVALPVLAPVADGEGWFSLGPLVCVLKITWFDDNRAARGQ